MKKTIQSQILILIITTITFLMSHHPQIKALERANLHSKHIAHTFSFLNKNQSTTKKGITKPYDYSYLHSLMATGQDVEFDTTYNEQDNKTYICHSLNSSCNIEFKTFLQKHANNYKSLTIEIKENLIPITTDNPEEIQIIKNENEILRKKQLQQFILATLPYKNKIEVECFDEETLNDIKDINYKHKSLLLGNLATNNKLLNTTTAKDTFQKWKDYGIDTLLLTPENGLLIESSLKENWSGKRLGFWTLDDNSTIRNFNKFVNNNISIYKEIYYMTSYGNTIEGLRAIKAYNLVKSKRKHSYMIWLLSYKNGIIIKNKYEFQKWKYLYTHDEKIRNNKIYTKLILKNLKKLLHSNKNKSKKIAEKFHYKKVKNYFQFMAFENNIKKHIKK